MNRKEKLNYEKILADNLIALADKKINDIMA